MSLRDAFATDWSWPPIWDDYFSSSTSRIWSWSSHSSSLESSASSLSTKKLCESYGLGLYSYFSRRKIIFWFSDNSFAVFYKIGSLMSILAPLMISLCAILRSPTLLATIRGVPCVSENRSISTWDELIKIRSTISSFLIWTAICSALISRNSWVFWDVLPLITLGSAFWSISK